MKIGMITTPNDKGQIVIPKRFRDALGIDTDSLLNLTLGDNRLYIDLVNEIYNKPQNNEAYLKVLRKTQGAWSGDSWGKNRKARRKIEIAASGRRKQAW